MAYFINTSCDFAVLETGLGGRLDSTNFCIPAVSVITSIGFDHTAILGNTLGEIAGEKAGIIKKNIPVVSSYLEPEALARIKEEARLKGSPFYYFPECVSYRVKGRSERGSTFSASIHNCGTGMELNDACLSQPGDVFLENFLLSLLALTAAGMPFSEKGILEAAWSRIPFRMEKRGDILIDVAHNDSSLECLFKTVRDYFKPLKTNLHVGILKDKELTRISKKIFEYESMFSKIVLFDFPTPRGSGGRALFESLRALPQVKYSGEFPEILHEDGVLNVFTGSFQIIDRILDQISADRYEYSSFLNESLDIPEWEKIYTEAVNQKIPALRPFSCKFLYFLVKIARPEKILEIGTGSGYSTLWIARGLSGKAVLISLERDRKRFDLASKLFRDNPRVRVLHRDAFKYLGENSDIYDFVFLDAQKRDYLSYLELLKSRIKTGGILVADNFLLGGLTASLPELKKEKYQGGVRLLRAFNYELSRGGSFETLFVSIEDGLTIALKK
jgi:folylpolyglutamate synthase/dihydrofolate synthase